MRRIAGLITPALLLSAAVGCAATPKPGLAPLPEPFVNTRKTRPTPLVRPPRAARPRATKSPSKTAKRPTSRNWRETRAWTPRGGVSRRWQNIVIHHSATPRDTPQGMDRYHRSKGWENGLGYHFVIGNGVNYANGQVYVGLRWKRQIAGAHCGTGPGRFLGVRRPDNYFNEHGIGICLIGDLDQTRPTAKQLAALQRLTRFLRARTGIDSSRIYGHGQIKRTNCPGRRLNLAAVRRNSAQITAASR